MTKKTYIPWSQSIEVFSDDRGVFVPFIQTTGLIKELEEFELKRVYYIYNYGKGVIRGFHFHKIEWKFFFAVNGAAKIVAVNPKKESEKYTFTISSRKPALVIIPPGYAHGSISLEDQTILVCCSNVTTDESLKDDTRYDPYAWGNVWEVKGR